MSLQISKTLDDQIDGGQSTCTYHYLRYFTWEGPHQLGLSFQSYTDAAEFAALGLDSPRATFSVSYGNIIPNQGAASNIIDWAEKWVIANIAGWQTATQVA